MLACKVIMKHGGNIVRVSYNRSTDLRTLFVEVKATPEALDSIAGELESISYIKDGAPEERVIVLNVRMKDVPGALYPVLKVFDRYDVNLTYLNSNTDNADYQNFKMGVVIDEPGVVRRIIGEISQIYQVDVTDYSEFDKELDDTVYCVRMANDVQREFSLTMASAMELIRAGLDAQERMEAAGRDPRRLFERVRGFADFVASRRGRDFAPAVTEHRLADGSTVHALEPPCGSNMYLIESGGDVLIIDTGLPIFSNEVTDAVLGVFPAFFNMGKEVLVTSPSIGHCGMLSIFDDARITVGRKAADALMRQFYREADWSSGDVFRNAFDVLCSIVTDYAAPDPSRLEVLPSGAGGFSKIGEYAFGGMRFEVHELADGRTVYACREAKVVFAGDVCPFGDAGRQEPGISPEAGPDDVRAVRALAGELGPGTLVCCAHCPPSRLRSLDAERDVPLKPEVACDLGRLHHGAGDRAGRVGQQLSVPGVEDVLGDGGRDRVEQRHRLQLRRHLPDGGALALHLERDVHLLVDPGGDDRLEPADTCVDRNLDVRHASRPRRMQPPPSLI